MTLTEGRCSHFATVWHEGIIIGGGINSEMVPLGSCMYLSYADQWHLTTLDFTPSLPKKWGYIDKLTIVQGKLVGIIFGRLLYITICKTFGRFWISHITTFWQYLCKTGIITYIKKC